MTKDEIQNFKRCYKKYCKSLTDFETIVLYLHDERKITPYQMSKILGRSDMYITRKVLKAKKEQLEHEKNNTSI